MTDWVKRVQGAWNVLLGRQIAVTTVKYLVNRNGQLFALGRADHDPR